MQVSITAIKLKTPLHLWGFIGLTLAVAKQIQNTPCVAFRKTGGPLTFYTMTLWHNANEMHEFVRSGAHLAAMKKSKTIAKEIRTLTIETDTMPDWPTAKKRLLAEGKLLTY